MSGFSMVFWSQLHTLGNWVVINQSYTIGMRVVLKLAYHSWKHGNHILHDCPLQVSQESRGKDTHPTLSHTYTHSPSVSGLLEELTLTHFCIWLPHLASREMAPCTEARFWNIKAGTYCRLLIQESPKKREAWRVKLHPCNGTHLKVLFPSSLHGKQNIRFFITDVKEAPKPRLINTHTEGNINKLEHKFAYAQI